MRLALFGWLTTQRSAQLSTSLRRTLPSPRANPTLRDATRLWARDVSIGARAEQPPGALAPLTRDVTFQRAFGTDAAAGSLKHLLNAMLRTPDGGFDVDRIESVEIKAAKLHTVLYDVRCTLATGERVIVELQKVSRRELVVDRVYGYMARAYADQWPLKQVGMRRRVNSLPHAVYRAEPVRVLALLDCCLDPDPGACGSMVQHYHMRHAAASDAAQVPARSVEARLLELSGITLVQLQLAPREVTAAAADADKWTHLLSYSQNYTMGSLPEPLRAVPFADAAAAARIDGMSRRERAKLAAPDSGGILADFDAMYSALARAEQRVLDERAIRVQAQQRAEDAAAASAHTQ